MRRVMVLAVFMISAALLLIGGALGDLPSWRKDWPIAMSKIAAATDATAPAVLRTRSEPNRTADPARDAQQHEARELRTQIAQATKDLAALRATTEQTRQELASLRQHRDQEQAGMSLPVAQHPVTVNAASRVVAPPESTVGQAVEPVAAQPITPAVVPAKSPRTAVANPVAGLVVAQLTQARAALSSGSQVQARRHLRFLRSQMARLPGASPSGSDTGTMRGQVEYAIALLNRGDRGGAMQTIDQALAEVNDESGSWSRNTPLNRPDGLR